MISMKDEVCTQNVKNGENWTVTVTRSQGVFDSLRYGSCHHPSTKAGDDLSLNTT